MPCRTLVRWMSSWVSNSIALPAARQRVDGCVRRANKTVAMGKETIETSTRSIHGGDDSFDLSSRTMRGASSEAGWEVAAYMTDDRHAKLAPPSQSITFFPFLEIYFWCDFAGRLT
jgi:hypothetical protein